MTYLLTCIVRYASRVSWVNIIRTYCIKINSSESHPWVKFRKISSVLWRFFIHFVIFFRDHGGNTAMLLEEIESTGQLIKWLKGNQIMWVFSLRESFGSVTIPVLMLAQRSSFIPPPFRSSNISHLPALWRGFSCKGNTRVHGCI